MTFRQFALNNVRRNMRAYTAYFLSSAFAVMVFFSYAVLIFHPDITESGELGQMTQTGMQAAEYIIFVFSFLFVLYSVSAFLKVRKKEFGILTILGSSRGQLNRMVFLENMMIGLLSVVTGIATGMMLSKLFLLLSAQVLELEKGLPFYLPWRAIGLTGAAFLILFLVISSLTTLLIRNNRVIELLQSASKPKTEPKASILLSLLSAGSLAATCYLLLYQELNNFNLLTSLVLGTIGTYFMYTQLSVHLIRLLKKNRRFFWRGTRLVWLSELSYKVKDNARMFFLVTIITAVACTAVGVVFAFEMTNKQIYQNNSFPFTYSIYNEEQKKEKEALTNARQQIEKTLDLEQVTYESVTVKSALIQFRKTNKPQKAISQSAYNRIAKVMDWKSLKLKDDEAVFFYRPSPLSTEKPDRLSIVTKKGEELPLQIIDQKEQAIFGVSVLVIPDSAFQQADKGSEEVTAAYAVPQWRENETPNDQEVKLGRELEKKLHPQYNPEAVGFLYSSGAQFQMIKELNSVMQLIGMFIAAIFSISTASFLYFRLYTDLKQDQLQYRTISKIGMNLKEMRQAGTVQVGLLFFVPFTVAAIQTVIVLRALQESFAFVNMWQPSLTAIGAFFILQLIYFLVVRSRYLAQLKRVMV
ncbi:FtsX-like permease family protein [Paludifilum halophilum]|uniref:ABC3 transporter permease C-terminal domain-containing protein n=1 Tax=Paludifilum halophilum TaxID=1642702 RepID=A0A235B3K6_9BACL|nr:ABC transporter permease [Paludifilum halophilum]OYD06821.1 hypothetical protein CHM34_14825 [Paludifilum halophilum]